MLMNGTLDHVNVSQAHLENVSTSVVDEQNLTDWHVNISDILIPGETLNANNGNLSTDGYSDMYISSALDTVLFLMFIAVWLTSVACFYMRWNSVRMMSPVGGHVRFRYNPQNLDTITVVKTTDESVIYRK